MKLLSVVHFFVATTAVQAQSLLNATARYPQLSNFTELLSTFPDLAAGLLTNISTGPSRQTILVPSNDAFDSYQRQRGASVSSLSSSDVGNILNYHTLQGALSSSDIQQPNGLVSETALRNSTYARRENATDAGDSLPQVVYLSSTETATGRKIKARQISALSSVDVRSGQGNEIELEQTPGNVSDFWSSFTKISHGSGAVSGWPSRHPRPRLNPFHVLPSRGETQYDQLHSDSQNPSHYSHADSGIYCSGQEGCFLS